MIGELQHRTRNLFAVIGALAHFSNKNSSDFDGFRVAIDGRLNAMSTVRGWMVAERGVDIHTLTVELLKLYATARPIQVIGPPLTLSSDCAMSMSMAMHELATNAAKYGALSIASGKRDIQWDIARQASGEQWFSFK